MMNIHLSLVTAMLLTLCSCGQQSTENAKDSVVTPAPDTFAYRQLLPNGMQLKLPAISIDERLEIWEEDYYDFDCFLGYRKPGSERKLALHLNTTGGSSFNEVSTWANTIRATVPDTLHQNIWINVWLDERVPYYALHYLELHLRRAGLLKLQYRTADGTALPIRLPPFSENECNSMSDRPCLRKPAIAEDKQQRLQAMNLGADWAPILRYEDIVLRPENVFDLQVEPDKKLMLNGEPFPPDSLYQGAYEFLKGPGSPATKIFKVRVAEEAHFLHFLKMYNTLKLVYQDIWDEAAQAMYDKPYESLETPELRQVRSKWPIVIWLDKQY